MVDRVSGLWANSGAASLALAEQQAPDVDSAYDELLRLQESENRLRDEVGAARQKVSVLDDLRTRKVELESRRQELAGEIGRHKTLERAFGKDGVPALLIEQALPQIEEKANEIIDQRTVTEDYDLSDPHVSSTYGYGVPWVTTLWLRSRPTISLTSVTNVNTNFVYPVGNFRLRSDGRLRVMSGTGLSGYLSIVYVAGYAIVPFNYKQAALLILQHNWESRRGVGNVQSGVMGIGEQINPASFSIPPKAYEWLGPPKPGGP